MRLGRCLRAGVGWLCAVSVACGGPLVTQYEYEEEIFVDLDGSASVIVNTSIPALIALRGVSLSADPRARFDRTAVRRMFESGAAHVTRVSRPWRRDGRRFFQVRLEVDDLGRMSDVPLFGWSGYEFRRDGDHFRFRQTVGAAAGRPVTTNWNGDERVAFRLHLPSRILFHNAPSREVRRGNILVWEQPLRERLAGVPLTIEARLDTQSILHRTLGLFAAAFAAAVLALGLAVWFIMRRAPRAAHETSA